MNARTRLAILISVMAGFFLAGCEQGPEEEGQVFQEQQPMGETGGLDQGGTMEQQPGGGMEQGGGMTQEQ